VADRDLKWLNFELCPRNPHRHMSGPTKKEEGDGGNNEDLTAIVM